MKIPGFTAEGSFYKSQSSYLTTVTHRKNHRGSVTPAYAVLPPIYAEPGKREDCVCWQVLCSNGQYKNCYHCLCNECDGDTCSDPTIFRKVGPDCDKPCPSAKETIDKIFGGMR